MQTAKVGRGGQINLPKEIRERLGLEPGHRLGFVVEGERVVLQPLTKTLRDFRGSVAAEGEQDFSAIREQVMADRAQARAQTRD